MFNLLVTTPRFREEKAVEELLDLLSGIYVAKDIEIKLTNISGLITCYIKEDPFKIVEKFKEILRESPWTFRYILRVIPIEIVLETKPDVLEKEILALVDDRISADQTYKILIEKRHSNLRSSDIIKQIASKICFKVNLTRPDWMILIEILGPVSGISLLKEYQIFSSVLEKRNINKDGIEKDL
ncbi:MAG: RNA methyltransferase [Nitrososphaeraceae archaeon]|nr:RNA methyltransferase [Nitrososphaeraceae archaeon]